MKFYYVCVEQVWKEDTETGEKKLQEYITTSNYSDYESAQVGYFNRCAQLVNSVKNKVHQYAMIQLINSKFGVYDGFNHSFGEYMEIVKPAENTTENTEENTEKNTEDK